MAPSWSPDGRFIAFTSTGYEGIWVANAQGQEIRQLAQGSSGFGFLWSGDSESILARVTRTEERRKTSSLRTFRIEDGTENEITPYRRSMNALPAWNGSGESVLLPANGKLEVFDSGLQTRDVRGKDADSDASQQPVYLLIGNQIARVTESAQASDTSQPSATTPAEAQIEYLSPFPDQMYLNLQVSPDGKKLAFELYGGPLYVMNIDGSGLVELGKANRPRWSPDSRYLVAMVAEDDGYRYLVSDVVAFSADGSHQVNLTSETNLVAMNPDWSPSGYQIAFDSQEDGSIYVIDITREE